jgi:hypothetical protein
MGRGEALYIKCHGWWLFSALKTSNIIGKINKN